MMIEADEVAEQYNQLQSRKRDEVSWEEEN